MRKRARYEGLSLVETAIVLGVVGLVIGGIWVAAANVSQNYRISSTYSDVLKITTGAARLFDRSQYPAAAGSYVDITRTAYDANILPANYKLVSVSALGVDGFITTSGLTGSLALTYIAGEGPLVMITFYTKDLSGVEAALTPAECTQLAARFVQTDSVIGRQVWASKGANLQFRVFTLPANIMNTNPCGDNITAISLFIKP